MSNELNSCKSSVRDFVCKDDMYRIFQLGKTGEAKERLFLSYKFLKKLGKTLDCSNYVEMYSAPWEEALTLDKLFTRFNVERPDDFKGHSLSVSDVILIQRNGIKTAWYVDDFGFKDVTLEFFKPSQFSVAIANRFIMIQECDCGYDYSIVDARNYKVLDGGQYDDEEVSIWEVWQAVYEDMLKDSYLCGLADEYSSIVQVDYDLLDELVAEAEEREREGIKNRNVAEWFRKRTDLFFHPIHNRDQEFIEDTVRAYILSEIDHYNEYAHPDDALKMVELVMCGSRCRGIEKEDSDLDFLLEYTGNIPEDSIYNWMHVDDFEVCGIKVDINPVKAEKTGSADEILLMYDRYLMNHMRTISYEEQFTLDMIVAELINRGYAARKRTVHKKQGDKEGIEMISPSGVNAVIYLDVVLETDIFKKWTLDEIVKEYISINEKYSWKGMTAQQMCDLDYIMSHIYVGLRKSTNQNIEKKMVSLFEGVELEAYLYKDIGESDGLKHISLMMPYPFETLGIPKDVLWEKAWKNTFEKSGLYAMMHMINGNPNGPIFTISSDAALGAVSILNADLMLELLGYSETGKERFYVAASTENEIVLVKCNEGKEQSVAFQSKLQDIRCYVAEGELLDEGCILELDRKKLISLSKAAMRRELLKVMDELHIENSVCEYDIIQNGEETVLKNVSNIDAYMKAYEMSAEGNVACFMSPNGEQTKKPIFEVTAGVTMLSGQEVKSFACIC